MNFIQPPSWNPASWAASQQVQRTQEDSAQLAVVMKDLQRAQAEDWSMIPKVIDFHLKSPRPLSKPALEALRAYQKEYDTRLKMQEAQASIPNMLSAVKEVLPAKEQDVPMHPDRRERGGDLQTAGIAPEADMSGQTAAIVETSPAVNQRLPLPPEEQVRNLVQMMFDPNEAVAERAKMALNEINPTLTRILADRAMDEREAWAPADIAGNKVFYNRKTGAIRQVSDAESEAAWLQMKARSEAEGKQLPTDIVAQKDASTHAPGYMIDRSGRRTEIAPTGGTTFETPGAVPVTTPLVAAGVAGPPGPSNTAPVDTREPVSVPVPQGVAQAAQAAQVGIPMQPGQPGQTFQTGEPLPKPAMPTNLAPGQELHGAAAGTIPVYVSDGKGGMRQLTPSEAQDIIDRSTAELVKIEESKVASTTKIRAAQERSDKAAEATRQLSLISDALPTMGKLAAIISSPGLAGRVKGLTWNQLEKMLQTNPAMIALDRLKSVLTGPAARSVLLESGVLATFDAKRASELFPNETDNTEATKIKLEILGRFLEAALFSWESYADKGLRRKTDYVSDETKAIWQEFDRKMAVLQRLSEMGRKKK